jgi:hypothetical protein
MNFYKKYLKYKQKYTKLKAQMGGVLPNYVKVQKDLEEIFKKISEKKLELKELTEYIDALEKDAGYHLQRYKVDETVNNTYKFIVEKVLESIKKICEYKTTGFFSKFSKQKQIKILTDDDKINLKVYIDILLKFTKENKSYKLLKENGCSIYKLLQAEYSNVDQIIKTGINYPVLIEWINSDEYVDEINKNPHDISLVDPFNQLLKELKKNYALLWARGAFQTEYDLSKFTLSETGHQLQKSERDKEKQILETINLFLRKDNDKDFWNEFKSYNENTDVRWRGKKFVPDASLISRTLFLHLQNKKRETFDFPPKFTWEDLIKQ